MWRYALRRIRDTGPYVSARTLADGLRNAGKADYLCGGHAAVTLIGSMK
jgi:hypothetical protein